ncbi:cytochrome b561 and DOMON domain-containing protein At3g25290-like [Macadamia integrifolia]|uniref:cytochrome b561 and DOMON domain-containing protein At3g25290-like n=1 Tax=Macadamia integrifolia TaxID=60698 RepID=UPI001C4FD079|nr:cytochrome b561 and DOMON domain-containing protein At3g25290-like [Macadamia integrifolia]
MASSISFRLPLILVFPFLFLQSNPSHSLTCSSQKFSGNRVYNQCNDLPELSSFLHWTYDSSNSSLKIAFVAAPAKTGGWVAWEINPKALAMLGSQALIAYEAAGKMTVKTFDVSSYKIAPSKIAYEMSDMEAENADGTFTIFATIALPAKMTTINQVW